MVIGYEQSEQLEVEPAKYFVVVTKREKRACKSCEEQGVACAPLPARIIEQGLANDRVVIDAVVRKYSDHLPLYAGSGIKGQKVEAVVRRLIGIARPKKIILFGSYVRGELTPHSDLDVLVVTPDDVESPRRESVRLRNAVGDIRMPMDILVVPESRFRALRHKVGLIYREAALRGKVVYEAEG